MVQKCVTSPYEGDLTVYFFECSYRNIVELRELFSTSEKCHLMVKRGQCISSAWYLVCPWVIQ
jgi:hypothetical protein